MDLDVCDLGLTWLEFDSHDSMEPMDSLSSPPDTKPDIHALQQQQPSSTSGPGLPNNFFPLHRPGLMAGIPVSPPGGPPNPAASMHSPVGPHASMQSPSSTMSPEGIMTSPGSLTPLGSPNSSVSIPSSTMSGFGGLPMSTKHICAICGDRASGKHYGVYSCEGCKGFFKRTVRKDLTYACRDDRQCMIDKRQRNRCQYCRYMKCLTCGMKREAVQEERQRVREKGEGEVESTSSANSDMPVERITEAELAVEAVSEQFVDSQTADRQLYTLVEWAKRIPHFSSLPLEDQVILLRGGWNELLIAAFSHRSIPVNNSIILANGVQVHRHAAQEADVGPIFDRVLTELVAKMREMNMDKTELGCLRAIVLFNPDAKELSEVGTVETLREKVYASLEEYCKQNYPEEPGRFAKLLLRLPALRSIGLKCMDHLFFFKLISDTPIDAYIMEMLEAPLA